MAKKIIYHIPWIIWIFVITFLSFLPGDQLPDFKFEWFAPDTIAHIIMYAVLSVFFALGFTPKKQFKKKLNLSEIKVYLILIAIGIIIGYGVELIQGHFVYRRYYDVSDIWANSIGTLFGAFLYLLIGRKLI